MPATIAHVYALAAAMRAADAAEAIALGQRPKQLLRASFRMSRYARTAFVAKGRSRPSSNEEWGIAAMWGLYGNILSDTGMPWLVTTAAIERLPVTFVREGRAEVAAMLTLVAQLENHVDAGYTGAVRFLEVLGFTLDAPAPHGVRGALFRRFWKSR